MKGMNAVFLLGAIWWYPSKAHPGHDHGPPTVPLRFTMRSEVIDDVRNETHSYTETVDFVANFLRRDFVPYKVKIFQRYLQFGNRPLVVLADFNTGFEFVIDRWRSNCTIMNMTSEEEYEFTHSRDPYGMKIAFQFWFNRGLKYVKSETLRGLPVDVYQAEINQTVKVNTYFLQHTWGSVSDSSSNKEHGVPVSMHYGEFDKKTNKFLMQRAHIYDFTTDHTELASLRMQDCYRHNKHSRVHLKLEGKPTLDLLESLDVKYAILRNLSAVMNLGFVRISSLHFRINESDRSTWLAFTLYEPITLTSSLKNRPEEVSVDEAVKSLKEAVARGLQFTVPGFGYSEMISVSDVSVVSGDHKPSAPLTLAPDSKAGVIAGVGITLLIVGLAAGFGIAFVFRKRFPCDQPVPYAVTK